MSVLSIFLVYGTGQYRFPIVCLISFFGKTDMLEFVPPPARPDITDVLFSSEEKKEFEERLTSFQFLMGVDVGEEDVQEAIRALQDFDDWKHFTTEFSETESHKLVSCAAILNDVFIQKDVLKKLGLKHALVLSIHCLDKTINWFGLWHAKAMTAHRVFCKAVSAAACDACEDTKSKLFEILLWMEQTKFEKSKQRFLSLWEEATAEEFCTDCVMLLGAYSKAGKPSEGIRDLFVRNSELLARYCANKHPITRKILKWLSHHVAEDELIAWQKKVVHYARELHGGDMSSETREHVEILISLLNPDAAIKLAIKYYDACVRICSPGSKAAADAARIYMYCLEEKLGWDDDSVKHRELWDMIDQYREKAAKELKESTTRDHQKKMEEKAEEKKEAAMRALAILRGEILPSAHELLSRLESRQQIVREQKLKQHRAYLVQGLERKRFAVCLGLDEEIASLLKTEFIDNGFFAEMRLYNKRYDLGVGFTADDLPEKFT